jgi:hypothetical protein
MQWIQAVFDGCDDVNRARLLIIIREFLMSEVQKKAAAGKPS